MLAHVQLLPLTIPGPFRTFFLIYEFVGFLFQNYQLYKIASIDAGKEPVLFKLKDLMDDMIPGNYYETQLTKAEAPQPNTFYRVEKILEEEDIRGKKHYLVKYLHYGPKFNRWVAREDLLK